MATSIDSTIATIAVVTAPRRTVEIVLRMMIPEDYVSVQVMGSMKDETGERRCAECVLRENLIVAQKSTAASAGCIPPLTKPPVIQCSSAVVEGFLWFKMHSSELCRYKCVFLEALNRSTLRDLHAGPKQNRLV